jgi:hypothetical protein
MIPFELELFETLPFKAFKPNHIRKSSVMSYEGNMKLAESRPKNNPKNNATIYQQLSLSFLKDSYKYGTNQSK